MVPLRKCAHKGPVNSLLLSDVWSGIPALRLDSGRVMGKPEAIGSSD
jgi:hypothetical protein